MELISNILTGFFIVAMIAFVFALLKFIFDKS